MPKRKKKSLPPPPPPLPMQIPLYDREKFLDALAELLWPRIEEKVRELAEEAVDEAVDNLYIGR